MHLRLSLLLIVLFTVACNGCPAPGDNGWPRGVDSIEQWLDERATALVTVDDAKELVDEMGDHHLLLLGEATHGTREFYDWRAELSLEVAREHGLDFVAVEGDWLSTRAADRYVMGESDIDDAEQLLEDAFPHWPFHWMWANEHFAEFLERVRQFNQENPHRPIRIYGIDMQNFFDSLDRLVERLEQDHPDAAAEIVERLDCFGRFSPNAQRYSRHVQAGDIDGCADEIRAAAEQIEALYPTDGIDDISMHQHARVVASGERQYRRRVTGDPGDFWNVRVQHMTDTAEVLLDAHGDDARGAVWAHNTHVGDARATQMIDHGRANIGQLARQQLPDRSVFALGFSTYTGEVIAAANHGHPPRVMELPEAADESVDQILNRLDESQYLLMFKEEDASIPVWNERPGQRAVGVTYHPQREVPGNYVPTNPAQRYDALIFIAETTELKRL